MNNPIDADQTNNIHRTAVIGSPIGQSLSPLMHSYWFRSERMSGSYEALEVSAEELETALSNFCSRGYAGFNVTVPHKTAIVPLLDRVTPLARQMGAVNTVKINADGTTTGINTDGIGFLKHLNLTVPGWAKDKPVLLLGSGGAARAAALALLNDKTPMIMMCNRTREKAEAIASDIGRGRITTVDWADRDDAVMGAGLVVNTTTLGMTGQPSLDLDLAKAGPDTVVYDIVYKPLVTPLIAAARARGLKTVDGLGMLVYQGAAAFKAWFDRDVGFDDGLRVKLLAALKESEPTP